MPSFQSNIISVYQIAEKSQMEALMKRTEFDHPAISKVQIDDLHLTKIYLTDKVEPEVLKHALEFFYSGMLSVFLSRIICVISPIRTLIAILNWIQIPLQVYMLRAVNHSYFSSCLPPNNFVSANKWQPKYVLHYMTLISGTVSFDDDPSTELLDSIREFCDMFDLPYLKQICDNVENDEEFLNPSIGTYVCDLNGQKMKALFFNQQAYADADVKFTFGGEYNKAIPSRLLQFCIK